MDNLTRLWRVIGEVKKVALLNGEKDIAKLLERAEARAMAHMRARASNRRKVKPKP